MTNEEVLQSHVRSLNLRTYASFACYAGFLLTAIPSALAGHPFEHPMTLAAIGLVLVALAALPREYMPASLSRVERSDEVNAALIQIQRAQRWGMYLRLLYVLGAVIALLVIPRLSG